MLKRFFLGLAILAGLFAPVHAAGTISLSMSQQFDQYGKPLSGGKLYFYQSGTVSTPQNAFYDAGLTLPLPNPVTLDAAGRVPAFYLADGSIKVRLTDKNGIPQLVQDNLLVIGPSSGGGGGGGSVDPTTVIATGDIKTRYGTGTLTGFVRLNGRTIGSATSGATERANSDTQALFEYLWNADANLTVSTGRGVSSAADWAANKTIGLPDGRGRVLAALDDMGNSAAGRLTASYFGTAATVLGAAGGTESYALSLAQIPAHSHGGATASGGVDHDHKTYNSGKFLTNISGPSNGVDGIPNGNNNAQGNENARTSTASAYLHAHGISSEGGGGAHPIVQPTLLITNYMKL